jgi:hypothetical protein
MWACYIPGTETEPTTARYGHLAAFFAGRGQRIPTNEQFSISRKAYIGHRAAVGLGTVST